jgi:hypothetical protein
MLFFRSEETLNQWLASRNAQPGAVLTLPEVWKLSQRWYHNRTSPEYHGRTMAQVQELFQDLGLTSGFWQVS